ncbi:MAG: uridine kinase [Gammaproteobacteria bacterium]|nr:uridine kinase [Gammaproteobacteria bacterium]
MKHNMLFIAIAGPSASGKSLLASTIVEELGSNQVIIISEDSYYRDRNNLSFEQREKINYDHPDAFDRELMYEQLSQLQNGKTVHVPVYDYVQHTRSNQTRTIGQHRIIVLEGILLLDDAKLRELVDINIFMDTPLDTCLIRRLRRDVKERDRTLDSVLGQYETTVRPMYYQFIEPSKRYADIIVPHGGKNRIAIEVIKAQMRELLEN